MDQPAFVCHAFWLPKEGSAADEYEDAFAVDPGGWRFAVADGASESSFAGAWARLIVERFVATPGPWSGWLPKARADWLAQLQDRELPWYAETKFQEGAFATLLGLTVNPDGSWRAVSVGDSCLFQVRAGGLRLAFPIGRSADFDNQPDLLCSRQPAGIKTRRRRLRGAWQPGDVFYLTTDALAAWFLRETEEGRRPWEELQALPDQAAFADFVQAARGGRNLRNDDVTLLAIQLRRGTVALAEESE